MYINDGGVVDGTILLKRIQIRTGKKMDGKKTREIHSSANLLLNVRKVRYDFLRIKGKRVRTMLRLSNGKRVFQYQSMFHLKRFDHHSVRAEYYAEICRARSSRIIPSSASCFTGTPKRIEKRLLDRKIVENTYAIATFLDKTIQTDMNNSFLPIETPRNP